MAETIGLTDRKFGVALFDTELSMLVDFHISQKIEAANKEQYELAELHRKRGQELMTLLQG